MSKKFDHLRPTIKEALEKGASFCAYQERCQQDVRKKLATLELDQDDIDEVLYLLIQEGFLNEERFALAYCRGKFKHNKWGKNKIKQQLKAKQISNYCIQKGLAEIDQNEYLRVLKELVDKKKSGIKDTNPFVRKKKVLDSLQTKGYEYNLILELL